jgi:hypothetical protein
MKTDVLSRELRALCQRGGSVAVSHGIKPEGFGEWSYRVAEIGSAWHQVDGMYGTFRSPERSRSTLTPRACK